MEFIANNLIYLIPFIGIGGLVIMLFRQNWVTRQDAGDQNMKELAGHIADGAMAFLKAEWKILSYFVVIVGILLSWSGTMTGSEFRPIHSSPIIGIAFVMGAVFSAFAGFVGMRIATKANVRTTQAARTSLAKALKVSF